LESGKNLNLMKFKILPIAGDASFRKFYRIILNDKKKILVFTQKEKYKNLVAYIAVNEFLRKNNLHAPKTFSHNIKQGIIIIEDFGNLSFHRILKKKINKFKIYKQLIDLLIKIQKIKPKSNIKSLIGKSHKINKYSQKYLEEESSLFFEWYLPLVLKKKKIFKIEKKLKKELSNLYKKLYFQNKHFTHRDFHVENLMKFGKKVGVIDSQDALIGNPAYDLVSLIDDVRIKTSEKLKNKIYNYYLKKNSQIIGNNKVNFLDDFEILSIQRNLKIIGVFARLYKRDKKDKYLELIPYTWKLIEKRLKSSKFSKIKAILDEYVPKSFRKKIIN